MIEFSRIFLSVFAGFLYCTLWNEQGHAQNDAATRLAPKGELRAGLIASNPVLVTRGADGQLGGVSVELARALAGKLGVPVRLIPTKIRLATMKAWARMNGTLDLPRAILRGLSILPSVRRSWRLIMAT